MARAVCERRVQHLGDFRARLEPGRDFARSRVVCLETQLHAWQPTHDEESVVRADAHPEAHVGHGEALVQGRVARDQGAHQHVRAARLVLGQRLHHDVHAHVETTQRESGRPGVIQRDQHPARARRLTDRRQVRHFHRYRAWRLGPDQLCVRLDQVSDAGADQGVVIARGDAEVVGQPVAQFAVRVVDVVGQEHVVAGLEQREVDHSNGGQPARGQQAVGATFQFGQARFQRKGGWRAVQPVGIGVLVFPFARSHRRDVLEQDRRGVVDRRRVGVEAFRGGIRRVDDRRLEGFFHGGERQGGFRCRDLMRPTPTDHARRRW